jgi:hypothetical protein
MIVWTPWRLVELVRLQQAGASPADMATALGMSEEQVLVRLSAMSAPARPGWRGPRAQVQP